MGMSCTTTPRLEIGTLNQFENGPLILTHMQKQILMRPLYAFSDDFITTLY